MAQAFSHALADELDLLNLKERNGDSSDEEDPPSVEQEFSCGDQTGKLLPVQVTTIVNPNRLVVRLWLESVKPKSGAGSDGKCDKLAQIFYEFKGKEQAALSTAVDLDKWKAATVELYSKNKYVILETSTWGKPIVVEFDEDDLNEDDDMPAPEPEESMFSTGIILSFSPNEMTYQVFLCDLGLISTCSLLDMSPIPPGNEYLLENPHHALVTIPGIVPRKRMDNIPGLSTIDFQDRDWNKGAREDVQNWLSQYKVILLCKIIKEASCLFYGDFYGANDTETKQIHRKDLLTSYLTSQKNVFFNYQLLNRIYETKD